MLMKKLLFCFFMSLLMVASAVAQTRNITVRGKVIDKDSGEPVVQATIQMLSLPDSTYVNGAATLDDGTFELPKVSAGNYVMKISFIGYKNILSNLLWLAIVPTWMWAPRNLSWMLLLCVRR